MNLKGEKAGPRALAARLGLRPDEATDEMRKVVSLGLARKVGGGAVLTAKGRRSIKVVFVGGGF